MVTGMSGRGRARAWLAMTAVCITAALGLQSPGDASTGTRALPTGAGHIYHWGNPDWQDEFETPCGFMPGGCAPGEATKSPPLSKDWNVNAPNLVEDKWGQIVMRGQADGSAVTARLTGHPHRYGRWEVRLFTHQIKTFSAYRYLVELVPANTAAYHCGAQNITVANYVQGAKRTTMSIRTLPNRQFTFSKRPNLGPWDWNTYAVEITKSHISWFVDDHVVMTERRPAALSGVAYTLRLQLVGNGHKDSTPPKMQLDWTRHFSLARPNSESIRAPQAHVSTYRGSC
jgi:hypothetical protein